MKGLKPETEKEFLSVIDYLSWWPKRNVKVDGSLRFEFRDKTYGDLYELKYGIPIEVMHLERGSLPSTYKWDID